MTTLKAICVYCGSSTGGNPEYARAAREMGEVLARSGRTLVYGGGGIGLMGEMARATLGAGGRVIGVIPAHLNTIERAFRDVELRVVSGMHERKQTMADLADAFVAMPGGLGTFDELFEILTWNQIGLHRKPVGILNSAGYFDALLAAIEVAVKEGFIPDIARSQFVVRATPSELLEALEDLAKSDTP